MMSAGNNRGVRVARAYSKKTTQKEQFQLRTKALSGLVIKLPAFNIFARRSPLSLSLYQRLLCFLLGLFL